MRSPRRLPLAIATTAAAALTLGACGDGGGSSDDGPLSLTMYYPIAVGGPLQEVVDDLVEQCTQEVDSVAEVEAVYAGSYADTMTKAQTAARAGEGPDVAVLQATDLFTLLDNNLIVALDDLDDDLSWTEDQFFPGFLAGGQADDQLWSLPFQRSTIVQYYNKDLFEEAGLDPEAPPSTWDELEDAAAQIQSSGAADYGVEIPSTQFGNWMLQAMSIQSSVPDTAGVDGMIDYLDSEGTVAAMDWWLGMTEDGIMPSGTTEWASAPEDFLQGRTGIMWHTTGNLTDVLQSADFEVGVSMLPANSQPGSPTGGGNLYVFDSDDEARHQAAYEFSVCLTEPERAAQWSMDSGYVATGTPAWETDIMADYAEENPQATVARDQLDYAEGETSTHENQRVAQAINDGVAAVLTGAGDPASVLGGLQSDIDDILQPYGG